MIDELIVFGFIAAIPLALIVRRLIRYFRSNPEKWQLFLSNVLHIRYNRHDGYLLQAMVIAIVLAPIFIVGGVLFIITVGKLAVGGPHGH